MPSSDTQFKKGHKRGKGRKKGSKNKLTRAYLKAFTASFMKNDEENFEKLRKEDLSTYMRLAGALVPKDLDVNHSGDITIQIIDYKDDDKQG